MKSIYKKPIANFVLSGERLLSHKTEKRKAFLLFPVIIIIKLEVLMSSIRQEKI